MNKTTPSHTMKLESESKTEVYWQSDTAKAGEHAEQNQQLPTGT